MNYKKINKETYNNIANDWDDNRKYSWKPVVNFLTKLNDDLNIDKIDFKILDLGCGTGRHLKLAHDLGFIKENLIGSDISSGQLKIVKKKGFKTKLCDMENLDFENQSIDIIMCIAVLHHLTNKSEHKKAVEEMYKILKPNGKIVISSWFPQADYTKKQIEKGKFEFVNDKVVKVTYRTNQEFKRNQTQHDRFYYFFDEIELIDLFINNGFNFIEKENFKGNLFLIFQKK